MLSSVYLNSFQNLDDEHEYDSYFEKEFDLLQFDLPQLDTVKVDVHNATPGVLRIGIDSGAGALVLPSTVCTDVPLVKSEDDAMRSYCSDRRGRAMRASAS
jgi:hypothetical protein